MNARPPDNSAATTEYAIGAHKARKFAFVGFVIAFAGSIPAWIHSGSGQATSGWLYLAFALFGIGFLVAAFGVAIGIRHEFFRRDK